MFHLELELLAESHPTRVLGTELRFSVRTTEHPFQSLVLTPSEASFSIGFKGKPHLPSKVLSCLGLHISYYFFLMLPESLAKISGFQ